MCRILFYFMELEDPLLRNEWLKLLPFRQLNTIQVHLDVFA